MPEPFPVDAAEDDVDQAGKSVGGKGTEQDGKQAVARVITMLPDRARRVTDILAACPRTVTAAFAVTRLTAVKYPAIADESA